MVGGTWPPFGRLSEGYGKDTVQMEWLPPSPVVGKVGYAVMPGGWSMLASGFMLSVHQRQPEQGGGVPLRPVDEQPDRSVWSG